MKEYFHSWRRKAGVVTLGLALTTMGMWVRSFVVDDEFALPHGHAAEYFISGRQSVAWWSMQYESLATDPIEWKSTSVKEDALVYSSPYIKWQWLGFGYGELNAPGYAAIVTFRFAPYWSISIPLTFLSAYLLLWKPRKRPSPN